MDKKRIEFIDLAKGVCILLVVIGHCGINTNFPGLESLRMPLYFILSGLFFKDYGGIIQFIVKKTNKILIPFLFFYLISYIPYYIFEYYKPGLIKTQAEGIFDVFNNRQYFNGPIWFLICLFWSNIIFCIISLKIKKEAIRAIIVILIGCIGVGLGEMGVFLPCMFDVSMSALPFFYFGYILKKTPILFPNNYDKYNFLFAICLYVIALIVSLVFNAPHISFHYNKLYGNLFAVFLLSISSVMAILFLCKTIGYIPVLSYMGRYSIIVLCVHHLIYRPIKLFLSDYDVAGVNYWIALATVILSLACIPICKKIIPWFTAQKDLI